MTYIRNPKTEKSGIFCCIPQEGKCKIGCKDCFFNGSRSYVKNTPNYPPQHIAEKYPIRVNDGNDSNNDFLQVITDTMFIPMKFYNTCVPKVEHFPSPVVLTINPSDITDTNFHKLKSIPDNLMFVRIRVNTWNIETVVKPAVDYYTSRGVPVVLTFMAYYTIPIPEGHKHYYVTRKRTTNIYDAIKGGVWKGIMEKFEGNKLVYSCGEDINGTISCKYCGNCMREFWNTTYRLEFGGGR